jgi:hypothetical protein
MNGAILMVMVFFALAAGAQAKNHVYGVEGSSIEGEGYKLFASDKIVDTVDRNAHGNKADAGYCTGVDVNTSKSLGNIAALRADNRLSIGDHRRISYYTACLTFNSLVERLKTADDIRRLWLLFGDSATDDFVVETLKETGFEEERSILIETKRLAMVSKYLEFFTKNKDWKLTEYTFLSQAFKLRKGKTLSPVYRQFIEALLTGDTEKAFRVVTSIDLDNLGGRFSASGTNDGAKAEGRAESNKK